MFTFSGKLYMCGLLPVNIFTLLLMSWWQCQNCYLWARALPQPSAYISNFTLNILIQVSSTPQTWNVQDKLEIPHHTPCPRPVPPTVFNISVNGNIINPVAQARNFVVSLDLSPPNSNVTCHQIPLILSLKNISRDWLVLITYHQVQTN